MKLAVVGNPIAHSKSPLTFRFLFDAADMEFSYEKLLVTSAAEIPALFKLGYSGINITSPFKQSILPFLDTVSVEASQIGSVNTVVLKNGLLNGFNTDYLGVQNALFQNNIELNNKKCLILGAGGAARAAIFALKSQNAIVKICNRTSEKAQALANEFGVGFCEQNELAKVLSETEILIDTLPMGIQLIAPSHLHQNLIVLDASYPKSVYSEKNVGKLIGGEHWLLQQALPAFELFTGIDLKDIDYKQKELLNLLNKS
jgi:shikimate dehydrogenase